MAHRLWSISILHPNFRLGNETVLSTRLDNTPFSDYVINLHKGQSRVLYGYEVEDYSDEIRIFMVHPVTGKRRTLINLQLEDWAE